MLLPKALILFSFTALVFNGAACEDANTTVRFDAGDAASGDASNSGDGANASRDTFGSGGAAGGPGSPGGDRGGDRGGP